MRRFLSPRRLSWMAVLGLAQITAGSAMGDWFEAYEAGNSVATTTPPPPQELEPSIAAALDENLEDFSLAEPGSIADEAEAKAAFPVVATSFLESVTSRFQPASSCDSVNCTSPSRRLGGLLPPWRPYLSGISGVDFATLDDDNAQSPAILNESVFTIGGALGMAIDRPMGALRIEIEGRGRDQMTATDSDPQIGSLTLRATDIWSATVNVWRDYRPYESLGIYAGGGIGTGGYRSTLSGTGLASAYTGNDPVTNFAWQAGGGVFYELTPRITFDVGYRFFAIDESTAVGYIFDQPFNYNERYSASELLLTVRVYEPFRRWR